MDFAAKLAQLERSANNARNNNNNTNNNNNNPNDQNRRRRYDDSSTNNNQQQQRNTRPRTDSYPSPRQQQQQQFVGRGGGGGGGDRRDGGGGGGGSRPNYGSYNNNNYRNNSNNNRRYNNSNSTDSSRSSDFHSRQQQQRGNRNNNEMIPSPQSSSSSYRPMTSFGSNNPNSNKPAPLEAMVRYGFNVAPHPHDYIVEPYETTIPSVVRAALSKQSSSVSSPRSIPHICLLAITIDELPYEHLWRHWAADSTRCYVSLICHAKYPDKVTSSFVKRRMLLQRPTRGRGKNTLSDPIYHTRRPEWGSIDITRAMIDLVAEGLRIGTETVSLDPTMMDTITSSSAVELSIETLEELDPRYSTNRFLITKPDHAKPKAEPTATKPNDSNENEENERDVGDDDDDDDEEGESFISSNKSKKKSKNVEGNAKKNQSAATSAESETTSDHNVKPDIVPPVDKFIYISETCIPVMTLEECCQLLFPPRQERKDDGDDNNAAKNNGREDTLATTFENTKSWLNAYHRWYPGTPKNKYESDQFGEIARMIPGQYRWKADQWHVLSRIHANAVVRIDERVVKSHHKLWNSFAKINASDEMYFPTTLALLGILEVDKSKTTNSINNKTKNDPTFTAAPAGGGDSVAETTASDAETGKDEETEGAATANTTTTPVPPKDLPVRHRPVTYTDWSEGMRNPATYTAGVRDFIKVAKKARQQGSLFARKFTLWPLSASGTTNNQQDPISTPGYISVEQWDDSIQKLNKDVPVNTDLD